MNVCAFRLAYLSEIQYQSEMIFGLVKMEWPNLCSVYASCTQIQLTTVPYDGLEHTDHNLYQFNFFRKLFSADSQRILQSNPVIVWTNWTRKVIVWKITLSFATVPKKNVSVAPETFQDGLNWFFNKLTGIVERSSSRRNTHTRPNAHIHIPDAATNGSARWRTRSFEPTDSSTLISLSW